MIVADLGAGTGHYAIPAGRIVSRGKVYAVEIQKDFLETIRNRVKESHLGNVECLWGNIEKIGGTKLGDDTIDRVIASNVFFQVDDKNDFIKEVKRILKPGGKVLLIDHCPERSHLGLKSAVSKEKAKEMFIGKGFEFEKFIDAGSHHYGIILINKK